MKELELAEIKEIEFNILKIFDAFCKENNIRYFLAYGTLLGAIRYKKFIPWDDDVDVLVPREDYNRLIKIFQDSERYQLFAFEKNKDFHFPFAKLCDMTTRKQEPVSNNGIELGVEIDIFPIDAWNPIYKKAQREAKSIRRNMMLLNASKINVYSSKSYIKRLAWYFIIMYAKLFGGRHYVGKITKKSTITPIEGAKYLGSKTWCVYGERGIIPAEAFADVVYVEFEGEMFPAPIGYDIYLTCLYGDYLPEPPIEKQKTHHSFKAYKL